MQFDTDGGPLHVVACVRSPAERLLGPGQLDQGLRGAELYPGRRCSGHDRRRRLQRDRCASPLPRAQSLGGLRDAQDISGSGFGATWPSGDLWPPIMRLDHVLVGNGVGVERVEVLDDVGADHRGAGPVARWPRHGLALMAVTERLDSRLRARRASPYGGGVSGRPAPRTARRSTLRCARGDEPDQHPLPDRFHRLGGAAAGHCRRTAVRLRRSLPDPERGPARRSRCRGPDRDRRRGPRRRRRRGSRRGGCAPSGARVADGHLGPAASMGRRAVQRGRAGRHRVTGGGPATGQGRRGSGADPLGMCDRRLGAGAGAWPAARRPDRGGVRPGARRGDAPARRRGRQLRDDRGVRSQRCKAPPTALSDVGSSRATWWSSTSVPWSTGTTPT